MSINRPLICIVEDDESTGRALARLVGSFGYETSICRSAAALLDSPSLEKTACLILDVNLPGLSGLELQTVLGTRRPKLPVIFLTGNGDVPMSVQAMRKGAIDFLLKPVSEQMLLRALARALNSRAADAAEQETRLDARRLLGQLTARELQVFRCVLTGAMNKQIAGHLNIAEKTVKVHRGHIMQKLSARTVVEFLELAQRAGVDADPDLSS